MKFEHLKIVSLVDSMLIWDRIAETGSYKDEVIRQLYDEEKIACNEYIADCPFCEDLDPNHTGGCGDCLWPEDGYGGFLRCAHESSSPFLEWKDAKTIPKMKKAAIKVFKMLETLEI